MNRTLIAGCTMAGVLAAQTPSTNTGATGNANSGPGTTAVSIRNLPSQGSTPPPTLNGDSRPLYISGRVTMDDGSPLPQTVAIQRNCYGNPRVVAYTNAAGTFSFRWSNPEGVVLDASDAGDQSRVTLSGASAGAPAPLFSAFADLPFPELSPTNASSLVRSSLGFMPSRIPQLELTGCTSFDI